MKDLRFLTSLIYSFGFNGEEIYLLESNQGELMVVLIERHGKMVHVVKLNEQRMEWEKVDNLHSQTVFTRSQTTMMKNTKFIWMENKVFFPRFYNWQTAYVDLVCDGELAFVPKSPSYLDMYLDTSATNIWSYRLGHGAIIEYWGTENADYSIWVDFADDWNLDCFI
uniref:Uncharacterized protein n=1 Tax=Oryza glumipatula TaxID=40148 RepID=A0A0E0B2F8_9ORYZ